MHRDAKAKAHKHARRIGADRVVDHRLKLRKAHYLVKPSFDLLATKAVHDASEHQVLATCEVRMKACAELN